MPAAGAYSTCRQTMLPQRCQPAVLCCGWVAAGTVIGQDDYAAAAGTACLWRCALLLRCCGLQHRQAPAHSGTQVRERSQAHQGGSHSIWQAPGADNKSRHCAPCQVAPWTAAARLRHTRHQARLPGPSRGSQDA